ncbi:MAG: hypothetical protein WCO05_04830 [Candidatus Moraniibacteriota bacterium]|jgi:hypothetical protein
MADSNDGKKKGNKKRMLIGIAFAVLAIGFLSKIYTDYKEKNKVAAVVSSGFSSKVLGQEDASVESATKKEEALASSENFNATQISVNGGVGLSDVLVDFEDSGVLTISNVKSELYTIKDGEKSEVKAIISCQTNKKTTIEIEYFKSGEKVNKIMKDDFFGLNHMVIITGLDADSVYRYSVKAVDPNGNKASSDQFVFYTGAPNVSLMDVLSNATQKVFGWAMKK